MDNQGTTSGAGVGGHPTTVLDIAVKLQRACRLAGVTKDQFKADLVLGTEERKKVDPRTVEKWFQDPSEIRGTGRKAIVQYFGKEKGLPFDNDCFLMSDAKFTQRMNEWENGSRPQ